MGGDSCKFSHASEGAGGLEDVVYEGQVSAIRPGSNGGPGFGFIVCEATKELFGVDVFLHSTQASVLMIGQMVKFSVQVNKRGQPQATNVEVIGWGARPRTGARRARPGG